MKIQCSCGAKYSFDVTPDGAANPVRFVCPACGVDSSAQVNELIRRELGVEPPSVALPPPAPPEPAPVTSRLKISHHETPAPEPVAATPGETAPVAVCVKHGNEPATEQCAVCHKPICPKCMELFGYFCSPFCKSKAAAESLKVPAYAGLGSAVEARFWRKTGLIMSGLGVVAVLLLGFAIWYNFFLALPHPVFSVPFPDRAVVGQSRSVAPDQLVFLHGATFARYDLKTKKPVWSHELFTQSDVDQVAAQLAQEESGNRHKSGPDALQRLARLELEGAYTLLGSGKNLWLASLNTLTRYDWDTGAASQTVSLGADPGEFLAGDGELLVLRQAPSGAKFVTHINYASGESRTEEFHESGRMTLAARPSGDAGTGLPSANGIPGQPLDPNRVADQAQNLTTPARLALPALLANNLHEQALEQAMQDDSDPQKPRRTDPQTGLDVEHFTLVPSPNGYVQYSVRLLEKRVTTRVAMKAPPAKPVVTGDLTAGQGVDAENEILNDMQRANGGDKVTEDNSRYQLTVRRPDAPDALDWTGEVIGPPAVYSQKTVNIVAAGSTVTVLDKNNKKLWTASLTYPVAPNRAGPSGADSTLGAGPCVEHGDTLYVVDQAVLTAFDLATGNARWRLPSVGIVGLFFDDQGHLYVNTTTANLDKIKYARQIDIAEAIDAVVLKVDAATGRNLWSAKTGGFVACVSGPFVYTFQAHDQIIDDLASDLTSGLQKPPFMKIVRLNPKTGQTLWEYDDDRAPVDVRFDQNSIYLVFHKEVQVLKFMTL